MTAANTDYGVYQLYGAHFVYGDDVLRYIGKAAEQTFGVRLQQHVQDWLADEHDVRRVAVYVGRVNMLRYRSWVGLHCGF